MENFVVCITAKDGSGDAVEEFYLRDNATYEGVKGYLGRQIYRAKTGTMYAAVKERMTAEEIAQHPEPDHGPGTGVHFIIVEQWESIDDRMNFSFSRDKSRDRDLFPLLDPAHSHEFYQEVKD